VGASGAPALTAFASGAGCGCKLPAADLLGIVAALPRQDAPRLLVGAATADDAAVFQVREDLALVQTVDFFTPVVDDPEDFGRIAAANALSDVYAMGGKPLTALNIVAFPLTKLGPETLAGVLRGGLEVASRAGVAIVGGHSIEDPEPKYGLAVTGTVDPHAYVTNAGGRAGDALVLTKPLGVGAIIAARRRSDAHLDDELLASAIETMTALNDVASQDALEAGAHAMTDVTGFGLVGHLHHLARESGMAAELDSAAVPALEGVRALLQGEEPIGSSGGTRRNASWAQAFTTYDDRVPPWTRRLLSDATTSGGLLIAVPARTAPLIAGWRVGRLLDGPAGTIRVR
jgi:selenide,water dikinase